MTKIQSQFLQFGTGVLISVLLLGETVLFPRLFAVTLVYFIALIMLVYLIVIHNQIIASYNLFVISIILLLSLITLTHVISGNVTTTMDNIDHLQTFGLFAFLLLVIPNYIKLSSLLKIISLIGLGLVVIGLPTYLIGDYNFLWGTVTSWSPYEPWSGIHVNRLVSIIEGSPNQLGRILIFSVIGSMYIVFQEPNNYLYYISGSVSFIGILLTDSRGAIGAIFLFFVIFIICIFIKGYLPVFGLLYVIGLVSSIFILYMQPLNFQEIFPLNFSGRDLIWKAGVDSMSRSPIIGHGLIPDHEILGAYHPTRDYVTSHSGYLRVLLNLGYIGLTALVLLLSYIVAASVRCKPNWIILSGVGSVLLWSIIEGEPIYHHNFSSIVTTIFIGFLLYSFSDRMLIRFDVKITNKDHS